MRKTSASGLLACALLVAGCGGGTIFKKSALGDVQLLSIDARQRLVLNGQDENGRRIVCAEPSPDAIVAQAASFAASGAYETKAKAGIAAALSESAGSIAMRTQTIQLLRDGYYRICEARLNGQIDDKNYKWTLRFIDEFIVTVAAIEALGGTVMAPPITIGAGSKATANLDSPVAEGDVPSDNAVGSITVNANKMSEHQANAIKSIVAEYYKRKILFHAIILLAEKNPERLGPFLEHLVARQNPA